MVPSTYQDTEVVEHISCTTIAAAIEFELTKLVQKVDFIFSKLSNNVVLAVSVISNKKANIQYTYTVFFLESLKRLCFVLAQDRNNFWLFENLHYFLYFRLEIFHLCQNLLSFLGKLCWALAASKDKKSEHLHSYL